MEAIQTRSACLSGKRGGPFAPVVVYISPSSESMFEHERATLAAIAEHIAKLKRCEFGGFYREDRHGLGACFFVPDETLCLDEAVRLGIRSPAGLFGGIVPRAFVGTKAITHDLVAPDAERPDGWSPAFAKRVRDVVLPGFTAFSVRDARTAAKRLLDLGTIRLKPARATGGGGQKVASDETEADTLLDQLPKDALASHGLVLEANLHPVTTLSVGRIAVENVVISYHGVQRIVTNNKGQPVYGGSDLVCVRGGWDALDRLPLAPGVRLAIAQARRYDAAASEFPSFIASRRNYDICQGVDCAGAVRSGVLEASWRSGGASTAEIAALDVFMRDPELQVVEACSVKQFGGKHEPPKRAVVHFHGDDPRDGPILRYTVVARAWRSVIDATYGFK